MNTQTFFKSASTVQGVFCSASKNIIMALYDQLLGREGGVANTHKQIKKLS